MSTKRKKMLTVDDAVITKKQHRTPCSDCPFRRDALPGWLAGLTPEQFVADAHLETRMDCHTRKETKRTHWQCAGVATYRANILKRRRSLQILELPQDKTKVFATPTEFIAYHKGNKTATVADVASGVRDAMLAIQEDV